MKHQADKRRSERSFNVGDYVFLKLQPYVQTSLAPRAHQKLSFRYFGPYKIIDKIGSIAYKLALPPSASIHPVFHVSLLKPAPPSTTPVSAALPYIDDNLQVPEAVLQRLLHPWSDGAVPQVLIKWSGLDASLATWEDAEALRLQFPEAPAWGQADTQGGGDVTAPHLSQPKEAHLQREEPEQGMFASTA